MLTDSKTASAGVALIPAHLEFIKQTCGSIEKCLDTIEGLNALIKKWAEVQPEFDESVDKDARWGLYIVTSLIHSVTKVAQDLKS